jgi:hypothetical protein
VKGYSKDGATPDCDVLRNSRYIWPTNESVRGPEDTDILQNVGFGILAVTRWHLMNRQVPGHHVKISETRCNASSCGIPALPHHRKLAQGSSDVVLRRPTLD